MNKTFYFPHDYDAASDDKILQMRSKFGLTGYALFWLCLETMAKNQDGHLIASLIGGLSISYGTDIATIQGYLDYCVEIGLFHKDETGYFTPRMMEHKKLREALSIGGKQGAERRWGNSPPNRPPNAKEKKRKEKKIKENKKTAGAEVSKFKFEEVDFKLAKMLLDLIVLNSPTFKPPHLDAWANEIRLMREADKRTVEQIDYVIRWCQKDSFWKSNILSAGTMRRQFDKLVAKIKSTKDSPVKGGITFIKV